MLDFKEIPQANLANGQQDTFELFARDVLESIGFTIKEHPSRGVDGGKDLIVEEIRIGIYKNTTIRWLVSCKHNAHSGKSVSVKDELSILDRIKGHNCNGFIGFYSTIASSALSKSLENLSINEKIEYEIIDNKRIEQIIMKTKQQQSIVQRYFINSFKKYYTENPLPKKLIYENPQIVCENCNRNLIDYSGGIFVMLINNNKINSEKTLYEDIYYSCKGKCDNNLQHKYYLKGYQDFGWDDIIKYKNPNLFILNLNTLLNGYKFNRKAIKKLMDLYLALFPYVSRELTSKEKDKNNIMYSLYFYESI